jgi:hypothetical protein
MKTTTRAASSRTSSAQKRTGRLPKAHGVPRLRSHREQAQPVQDVSQSKIYKAGQAAIQVEENGFNIALKIARPVVNFLERMVRFVMGSSRAAASEPRGRLRINVPSQPA